jgi:hypothetical protein
MFGIKQNVGKTDKIIRYILAAAFLYLGYRYSFWFYIIAAILIITAATGFCGAYKLLKINTAKQPGNDAKKGE